MKNDNIELQLLFVVMGEYTTVRVEHGNNTEFFWENTVEGHRLNTGVTFLARGSFAELRAAVDALKDKPPVPRIERSGSHYCLYVPDEPVGGSVIVENYVLDAVMELVGKPLPIWTPTKGEWIKLLPISSPIGYAQQVFTEIQENIPVEIWRYTRRTNAAS